MTLGTSYSIITDTNYNFITFYLIASTAYPSETCQVRCRTNSTFSPLPIFFNGVLVATGQYHSKHKMVSAWSASQNFYITKIEYSNI